MQVVQRAILAKREETRVTSTSLATALQGYTGKTGNNLLGFNSTADDSNYHLGAADHSNYNLGAKPLAHYCYYGAETSWPCGRKINTLRGVGCVSFGSLTPWPSG